jgi:putative ABC transport system permease protein
MRLFADLHSGLRTFAADPMLSLIAVLTLGLGIGLSTTIFSIVNGALFKGLPFEGSDRIVSLVATRPARNEWNAWIAVHDLVLWQARQRVFEVVGPYDTVSVNLSSEASRPERISAARLSVAAFDALRVKPILGRGLRQGDDRPGAPPIVLLGFEVWRDRFHAALDVIGKTIRTNGEDRTVVGVMPERFGFPNLEHLWWPLHVNPDETPRGKGPHFPVLARLKPGVSLSQAQAQVRVIASQLEHEFPNTNQGLDADVWPFTRTALGPEVFGFLYTALGAGIGVLIIACVNVSNLLVARMARGRRSDGAGCRTRPCHPPAPDRRPAPRDARQRGRYPHQRRRHAMVQ